MQKDMTTGLCDMMIGMLGAAEEVKVPDMRPDTPLDPHTDHVIAVRAQLGQPFHLGMLPDYIKRVGEPHISVSRIKVVLSYFKACVLFPPKSTIDFFLFALPSSSILAHG